MSARVHLSAPDVGPLEERYVIEAIRSGWVAPAGPDLAAFEAEVAARAGCAHAVAVSSGTAALHLALLGLGVGPGQSVIVPTLTFAATANAVRYTGAEPIFVDSLLENGNVDPDLLPELLRSESVGAVIAVDLFGSCADYARLAPLCAHYGVPLVEDAAEALGATSHGRAAGSFGTAGVISFNGNKIATTSGGGMLCSDDGALIAHSRYLATQARQPVVHYEHCDIGYNYRLSNILAALGRAQIQRLDEMIARRRTVRDQYAKVFAGTPGVRLLADDDPTANCWLTTVVVDPGLTGWTATELRLRLDELDIESRPAWKPMHLQPVYGDARAVLTGVAERLFATGLTLPSGSAMSDAELGWVVDSIAGFLAARS